MREKISDFLEAVSVGLILYAVFSATVITLDAVEDNKAQWKPLPCRGVMGNRVPEQHCEGRTR